MKYNLFLELTNKYHITGISHYAFESLFYNVEFKIGSLEKENSKLIGGKTYTALTKDSYEQIDGEKQVECHIMAYTDSEEGRTSISRISYFYNGCIYFISSASRIFNDNNSVTVTFQLEVYDRDSVKYVDNALNSDPQKAERMHLPRTYSEFGIVPDLDITSSFVVGREPEVSIFELCSKKFEEECEARKSKSKNQRVRTDK